MVMANIRRQIPSPAALITFEAAARCGSFTHAAEELHVSQAAVSSAIKTLEATLDVVLFTRDHRGIKLTAAGERYYFDVALALGNIANATVAITGGEKDHRVTVSCSVSFASHWLLPRLATYRSGHPDVDLTIHSSNRDDELRPDPFSIGIRRGLGRWREYNSAKLCDEIIFPVCSPSYLASIEPPIDVTDLTKRKLIHLDEPYRPRSSWRDWFQHFDVGYEDYGHDMRCNDYSLTLQAAVRGYGIALGWSHLVRQYLESGELVVALDARWQTGYGYYIVSNRAVTPSADVKTMTDWMLQDAHGAPPADHP